MNKAEIVQNTQSYNEFGDYGARFDAAFAKIGLIKQSINNVIFGQECTIDLCLSAILANGHALLVGMPGVAKTKLVNAIATSLGQDFRRIQFTPDLMPSDILGAEILETAADNTRHFRFLKGPIFTQILMADEINRASPKTQSALLEAMQEGRVTIAGQVHNLPKPFHVLATQNPIEHEGAYPLPEAQLDRFLLQINVPYPDTETERKILVETTKSGGNEPFAAISGNDLIELQEFVRDFPISEKFVETTLKLVRGLRPQSSNHDDVKRFIEWGPGPRAGQALIMAAKARALLRGRTLPTLDDLNFVAESALVHRISFNWQARNENISLRTLIGKILDEG